MFRRGAAFRNPRGRASRAAPGLHACRWRRRFRQSARPPRLLAQFRLALRIGPPMTRRDQSRRILIHGAIQKYRRGHECALHRTDPAAAGRPRDCRNPAMRDSARRDAAPSPSPKCEMFKIEAKIHGELRPARPGIEDARSRQGW